MQVSVDDFVLYTPFKGTDEENGRRGMKVLAVDGDSVTATDIFGSTIILPISRIEEVSERSAAEREFFDTHLASWKNASRIS